MPRMHTHTRPIHSVISTARGVFFRKVATRTMPAKTAIRTSETMVSFTAALPSRGQRTGRAEYWTKPPRTIAGRTLAWRVYMVARTLPRSASEPPSKMPILMIILAVTLGLAWRAGLVRRVWRPADAEQGDESGLLDACTRASVLVLFCL